MTITGMTRFVQQNYKVQNSHLTPKLPNGSLPPKGHVNPYCPEGMDITGRTDFRRIVPVDEGVANKIKSLVFERMEKNGGMSGGEIESEIIKDYVMSLPPEERAAAGWTLNQKRLTGWENMYISETPHGIGESQSSPISWMTTNQA